jgi:hypothetical protein
MPTDDPEVPRTQTSVPAKPTSTTQDVPAPRRDPGADETPPRQASDDTGVGGDRMPKGWDEPGAGM